MIQSWVLTISQDHLQDFPCLHVFRSFCLLWEFTPSQLARIFFIVFHTYILIFRTALLGGTEKTRFIWDSMSDFDLSDLSLAGEYTWPP